MTLEGFVGGRPTGPAIKLLLGLVAHFPAGQAITRRRARSS
jgi:hypothetical protein